MFSWFVLFHSFTASRHISHKLHINSNDKPVCTWSTVCHTSLPVRRTVGVSQWILTDTHWHNEIKGTVFRSYCGCLISVDVKLLSVCYVYGELTSAAAQCCCSPDMTSSVWGKKKKKRKTTSYLSLDFASGQPGGMLLHRNKTCSPACKLGASTNSEYGIPKY